MNALSGNGVVKYSPRIAKTAQQKNNQQLDHGVWMKPISRLKGNEYIHWLAGDFKSPRSFIGRLICTGKRSISCSPDVVIRPRQKLFFRRAIAANGVPARVVIDKSGANLTGLLRINVGLKFSRSHRTIDILRVKSLLLTHFQCAVRQRNNIVECSSR